MAVLDLFLKGINEDRSTLKGDYYSISNALRDIQDSVNALYTAFPSFDDATQTVYLSPDGTDSNSGGSADQPVSTLGAAVTAASAIVTAESVDVTIVCLSSATFTESVTIPDRVHLLGPGVTLVGVYTIGNCNISVDSIYPLNSSDVNITKSGTGDTYIQANLIDLRGTAGDKTGVIGLFNDTEGGVIYADIRRALAGANSTVAKDGATSTAWGQIFFHGDEVVLAGNAATAFDLTADSSLFVVDVGRIRESGTPTGTIGFAFNSSNTPTMRATVKQINVDIAWETLGTASLFLDCPSISGTLGSGSPIINGGDGNPRLAIKPPVKAVSDSDIPLTGEVTVNGTPVVTGDRVLIKNQTDPSDNGIYVVASGAWSRAADFRHGTDIANGTLVALAESSTTLRQWRLVATEPITLDTTELTFIEVTSSGSPTVTPQTVTVDDGATIADALHGILVPDGDNIELNTVVLLNSSGGSNAMAVTIDDDVTLPIRFITHASQTGTVTFNRETSGTINGGTSETMTGASLTADLTVTAAETFVLTGDLDKDRTAQGDLDMDGNALTGALRETITRGAGSSQPTDADSGAWITTDGAITIPNVEGWHCTLEFGGDHDVTHNSITWDTGSVAGDICSVQVKGSDSIRISPIVAAANVITESDFS